VIPREGVESLWAHPRGLTHDLLIVIPREGVERYSIFAGGTRDIR